jgi:hypothetical protein
MRHDIVMQGRRNLLLTASMILFVACDSLAGQTGAFQYKGRVPLQGNPVAVVSGDFNQDGNRDLAVVHFDSDYVSILFGDGNGSFQPTGQYTVKGKPGSIATGDWNGDGKPDLAIALQGTEATPPGIAILIGTGDGSFFSTPPLVINGGPTTVATADFNRDGKADLVVAYGSIAEPPFTVFLGKGEGSFDAVGPVTGGRLWAEPPSAQSMVIADLDNDGNLDLVISPRIERNEGPRPLWYATGPPDKIAVVLGNGDGSFRDVRRLVILGEPPPWEYGTDLVALAAGDFDGDGAVDLAILDDHSEVFWKGHLILLRGNGEGGFFAATTLPLEFNYPLTIAACDLGGKRPALVIPQFAFYVFGTMVQDAALWTYQGRQDGSYGATVDRRFNAELNSYGSYVHCSDLNNDRRPDLVFLNSNEVRVWLNTN